MAGTPEAIRVNEEATAVVPVLEALRGRRRLSDLRDTVSRAGLRWVDHREDIHVMTGYSKVCKGMVAIGALMLTGCATNLPIEERAVTVPMGRAHGLVFVEVNTSSGESLLALLDTGATASAIDPTRSGDLPSVRTVEVQGTTGSVPAELVRLDGLKLGSLDLPPLEATRRGLAGLLPLDGRPVDMILGSDALAGLAVTLDFEVDRVEVGSTGAADGTRVAMPLDNGIPTIGGTLGGVPCSLRIDTGASLFETPDVYVNVPTGLWTAVRSRRPELTPSSHFMGIGAGGHEVQLPVVPIGASSIGPSSFESVFIIVQPEAGYFADPAAKGFVGNNYLEKLGRVTLDYSRREFICPE